MEKQGGIYARYSPGRDRDQTSTIEAQVAMCCEKAQRDGVEIDSNHIYVDGGSPVRVWCGWGFQAMLAVIETGDFPEILYRQGRQTALPKRARSRKPTPKSVSIPNPSQNSPTLIPSETSPSKCLMPLKYKKTAVSGLIDEIVVHSTAALEIQCSFSNL